MYSKIQPCVVACKQLHRALGLVPFDAQSLVQQTVKAFLHSEETLQAEKFKLRLWCVTKCAQLGWSTLIKILLVVCSIETNWEGEGYEWAVSAVSCKRS